MTTRESLHRQTAATDGTTAITTATRTGTLAIATMIATETGETGIRTGIVSATATGVTPVSYSIIMFMSLLFWL